MVVRKFSRTTTKDYLITQLSSIGYFKDKDTQIERVKLKRMTEVKLREFVNSYKGKQNEEEDLK